MSQSVEQIMREALDKLEDRERKLQEVIDRCKPELEEVRRALKRLRRKGGTRRPALPAGTAPPPARRRLEGVPRPGDCRAG